MTKNSHRKRPIRTRMDAAGESYSVAARRVGARPENLYRRRQWQTTGWHRLLPMVAMHFEFAICTATELERDGDLADLFAWIGTPSNDVGPDGLASALTWHTSDEDAETYALREQAQVAFCDGVRAAGHEVPETVGELAATLAALGTYDHSIVGRTHRWRAPEQTVEPGMVLRLPDEWLKVDDRARFIGRAGGAASILYEFLSGGNRHSMMPVTIDQLAHVSGTDPDLVRSGIEGLCHAGGVAIVRNGAIITVHQLQRLADHARFDLRIDWHEVDRFWASDEDDSFPIGEVRWRGSPWSCAASVLRDARVSKSAAELAASFKFRLRTPAGRDTLMSVFEMAAEQGMSLPKCVEAMCELEDAGLLVWDGEHQEARLREAASNA